MYLRRDRRFIQTKFWGRSFWNYMFMYSKYVDYSKRTPVQHFKTLSFFVACDKCRCEFEKKLRCDPPPEEGAALFRWIWKYKNEVNARQRKNLKLNKQDITLREARREQSALLDSDIISVFFQKLIPSMPVRNPLDPARRRYSAHLVTRKLRILVQDMLDNPCISALLARRHRLM